MEAMDTSAADRLRSFVERIERLEEEKIDLCAGITDVYSEAKVAGFDAKIIRKLISLRRKSTHELEEEEQLLALYRMALAVAPLERLARAGAD
ncbi:DUF2312 domain-containing protein [Haematospirillum jordaniae]|uniref:DUF2312 domain-containing protein n=1 Tax=Haematospirillum jordaniae TaxID=1549855 RepID=UPI0014331F38|nr:DUF2312 domain-containing protein [Haematospirillum jordaniae]NKD81613.1 DUF2312 domain-containing protein [Haematospirillum jordaniae]NKD86220.1 DUF2312 domain-containing protein [Haematospirillum jordaniae]